MKTTFAFLAGLLLAAAPLHSQDSTPAAAGNPPDLKAAYFAGGCFWCMQYAFDRVNGVKKTVVGYTGGKVADPDYESVSSGTTGHAESIEVFYDPKVVSYQHLVDVFWKNINPTTSNGQFADHGTQYRTAIFYSNDQEKATAEASKAALDKSGKFSSPIATLIVPASTFYPAEEYHQEYYRKNPEHFSAYEIGSGRAGYIKRTWNENQEAKTSPTPSKP